MTNPLRVIFDFIFNPSIYVDERFKPTKIKHVFSYAFVVITLNLMIWLVISTFAPSSSVGTVSTNGYINLRDIISSIGVFIFAIPIIDGIVFRGPIANFSTTFKKICLGIFVGYFLFNLQNYSYTSQFFNGYNKLGFLFLAASLMVATPIFFPTRIIESKWFYISYTYFQALLFTILAVFNTVFSNSFALIVVPFIALNQIFLAFVTAYIACNGNLKRSIQTNIVINLITVFAIIGVEYRPFGLINVVFVLISAIVYLYSCWAFLDDLFRYKTEKNNKSIEVKLS
ncbi:MAG: hypothetical protein ACRCXZ_02785 [Patescibacteria group bacterium]